jgi:hypothetical protein
MTGDRLTPRASHLPLTGVGALVDRWSTGSLRSGPLLPILPNQPFTGPRRSKPRQSDAAADRLSAMLQRKAQRPHASQTFPSSTEVRITSADSQDGHCWQTTPIGRSISGIRPLCTWATSNRAVGPSLDSISLILHNSGDSTPDTGRPGQHHAGRRTGSPPFSIPMSRSAANRRIVGTVLLS